MIAPVYRIALVYEEGYEYPQNARLTDPKEIYEISKRLFNNMDREKFVVLVLDSGNKIIGINTVSIGVLNASVVHPREVYKACILLNGASIILLHNHPSGDCAPSNADIKITMVLKKAGSILDISVLDHVIVCKDSYYSFKERNIMQGRDYEETILSKH